MEIKYEVFKVTKILYHKECFRVVRPFLEVRSRLV